MRIAEIVLLWEGTLALLISISAYVIGRWWKEHVTRYIMALEVGLLVLTIRGLVETIVEPYLFHGDLTYLILYAIVMTYGAYGFLDVRSRDRAASTTDDWTE